jgi:hypothetical protein
MANTEQHQTVLGSPGSKKSLRQSGFSTRQCGLIETQSSTPQKYHFVSSARALSTHTFALSMTSNRTLLSSIRLFLTLPWTSSYRDHFDPRSTGSDWHNDTIRQPTTEKLEINYLLPVSSLYSLLPKPQGKTANPNNQRQNAPDPPRRHNPSQGSQGRTISPINEKSSQPWVHSHPTSFPSHFPWPTDVKIVSGMCFSGLISISTFSLNLSAIKKIFHFF